MAGLNKQPLYVGGSQLEGKTKGQRRLFSFDQLKAEGASSFQ